ncbi:MAG: hypothetical protein ABID83_04925 [Candidatus Omnitrophota bacterium]
MENIGLKDYQLFIKNISQLLSLSKLYNTDHPIFKDKLTETAKQLKLLTSNNTSLIMSGMGGVLFVNEQKIELKSRPMERFLESLNILQLGSVDIEPDFTPEDIIVLIDILNQKAHMSGVDQIKEYLQKNNITHIVPLFVSYKLVKEDEKIVKEKGAINVSDFPQDVIDKFSQDLGSGQVPKFIKEGNAGYNAIAHDPVFLSGFVNDFVEKKNTVEELENVLWLVGDYLIEEISTAREEVTNRKILDEFKTRLLSLWENKKEKNWHEAIHKNMTAISAALELKGLIHLYKKHKKGMQSALKKINSIMETLSQESRLYKKTKEDIDKLKLT